MQEDNLGNLKVNMITYSTNLFLTFNNNIRYFADVCAEFGRLALSKDNSNEQIKPFQRIVFLIQD